MALAQYTRRFWFPDGTLAADIAARVFPENSNALATLYTDATGTTTLTNPLNTTGAGILTFWAEEGEYWIHIDTESIHITVPPGPATPLTDGVSTGVLSGGEISVSATPDSVDIAAMTGYSVDYHTDPTQPTVTRVSIPAQTVALDAAALLRPVTWWLVAADGTIVQQEDQPTNSERRTYIVLGSTRYDTVGGTVASEEARPQVLPQLANQLFDLMDALGPFIIDGNIITANAGLTVAQSSGRLFARADNHFVGPGTSRDPHVHTTIAQDPASVRYVTQTTTVLPSPTTVIDPANYDVGGTITAVGGGTNRSTIQRIYLLPEHTAANQLLIEYGQTAYADLNTAIAAVSSETHIPNAVTAEGALIAFLVTRRTATDLSDPAQAKILPAARFGGSPAGGSTLGQLALYALLTGATFTGTVNSTLATAGATARASLVSGDTFDRYRQYADGRLEWGPGNAARDTVLYRDAANVLRTDDSLTVALALRHLGTSLGFYGAAATTKPTVSGSRGGNAALASLLTALAGLGLVTDSTTA